MKTIYQIIGIVFFASTTSIAQYANASHTVETGGAAPAPVVELSDEQEKSLDSLQELFPDVPSLQTLKRAVSGTAVRDRAGLNPQQIDALNSIRNVFPDVRSLRMLSSAIEGTVEREQAISRVTPSQKEAIEKLPEQFATSNSLESLAGKIDEISKGKAIDFVRSDKKRRRFRL